MAPGKHKMALYVGQCLPCLLPNMAKVVVKTLRLNEIIHAYYSEQQTVMADSTEIQCRSGDTVLVRQIADNVDLSSQSSAPRYHVVKMVYQCGDITDPLTQLSTIGTQYRHLVDLESELAGPPPEGATRRAEPFNYASSKQRGVEEGRRDWSHRPAEIKRQDDGEWLPHEW